MAVWTSKGHVLTSAHLPDDWKDVAELEARNTEQHAAREANERGSE